jgi:hypothetical protein
LLSFSWESSAVLASTEDLEAINKLVNPSFIDPAHLLSTRISPNPGVGRTVEGTSVPSGDPHLVKGRPLEDDTTRERRRSRHLEYGGMMEEAWKDPMGYVSDD